MVIILVIMAILSLICLIIGFTTFQKIQIQETEDSSSNQMFTFFRYSILFVIIFVMLGGGINIFMNAADYVAPSIYKIPYQEFKLYKKQELSQMEIDSISDAEFRQMYNEQLQHERNQVQENALKGILKSFGLILIPFPLFYFFARMRR